MSARTFVTDGPPRVVFGLGGEGRMAQELAALGAKRVLVVCMRERRDGADRVAAALGDRCVGVFDDAQPQVPIEVAEHARAVARQARADWVVAHGGGTPIGLAKAIALEVDVRIAAVPTTYAGSEMTEIYGITSDGDKLTGRDPRVRPQLVVYDPEQVRTMPTRLAATSLINAMAHSVEALYDPNTTDAVRDQAEQSVASLVRALRQVEHGFGTDAAAEAQYGAHLAASVLNDAAMALHHKLAHVLGGSFGLPHAETHTVLLPYTLAHNAPGIPEAMARLSRAFDALDPQAALWDLIAGLDLPVRLSTIGFGLGDVERCIEIVLRRPYANPIPLTEDGLRRTLQDAILGRRPSADVGRLELTGVQGPHAGLDAAHAGAELADARMAVIVVHGRTGAAETMLQKLDARPDDVAFVAIQAANNEWYPNGFREVQANRPWLDSALSAVDAAWHAVTAHVPAERVIVLGWSQGACLVASWLAARPHRPGALVVWTGAAIPSLDTYEHLDGMRIYVATASRDPWVTLDDVQATVAAMEAAGAAVTLRVEDTAEHGIRPQDHAALATLLGR